MELEESEESLKREVQTKDKRLQDLEDELRENEIDLKEKQIELRGRNAELRTKGKYLQEKDAELADKDRRLMEAAKELDRKCKELEEKDAEIADLMAAVCLSCRPLPCPTDPQQLLLVSNRPSSVDCRLPSGDSAKDLTQRKPRGTSHSRCLQRRNVRTHCGQSP